MISALGTSGNYILQPALMEKHRMTLEWLSQTVLWKNELKVFQKTLDRVSPLAIETADKQKIDHFQNLIIYYNGELVDELRKKLRAHESKLATMLGNKAEWDIEYFKGHESLIADAYAIKNRLSEIREELSQWSAELKR